MWQTCCSASKMLYKTLLISGLVHCIFGQRVMTGTGEDLFLTALDFTEEGDIVMYPNPKSWDLQQTDINNLDSGLFLNADSIDSSFESPNGFLDSFPVLKKRPNIKLIPRIGRKKRSLSDEHISDENKNNKGNDQENPDIFINKAIWDEDNDQDYLIRADKRKPRSKLVFIPRIGKKNSDETDISGDKRAAVFIPRIGRSSVLPKKIRYNHLYRLNGRSYFIPRFG